MAFTLNPAETRVLGCLLEKERLTPENYPISLNSLVAACNQATNRDPVVAFDAPTVERALEGLREMRLAAMVWTAGSRVSKYRHCIPDHFEFSAPEVALLTVLLLRGPQTPGELRARTDRMHPFATTEEVESCLAGLMTGNEPLARILPARPGQKEKRYVQLLSGEPDLAAFAPFPLPTTAPAPPPPDLREEVAALRAELDELKAAFAAFKRQFE
jgi:uncharacterized protein YceH (UPF0502 family)